MTKILASPPISPNGAEPDPFRFGWRFELRRQPDGTEASVEVPLTVEDLLHPREGDCIPENTIHEEERSYLAQVFRSRLTDRPTVRVFSDCIIDWGVEGTGNHSPDISVFENVRDRGRRWGIFPVAAQGARPLLAVEIVSPDAYDPRRRNNDVLIKREHYHRVGVPLYIVVDQEEVDGPRRLVGYRNTPDGYVELEPDERGRLLLELLRLQLGMRDDRVVCYDADTDEEIGDYTKVTQSLAAEVEARKAAEERIRQLEAELHRRRGEAQDAANDGNNS